MSNIIELIRQLILTLLSLFNVSNIFHDNFLANIEVKMC